MHTINKLLGSGGSRAGGYHYRSVVSCMRKLEFPNKLARSTSKIPGHTSKTWSFYIWLARNTRSWEVEHTSLPTKPSPTNQAPFQNSQTFSGTLKRNFQKKTPLEQRQNVAFLIKESSVVLIQYCEL